MREAHLRERTRHSVTPKLSFEVRLAAGFGMVVPSDEELRAVYVHPDHGRRGVGTAILKELEAPAFTV